MTAAIPPPQAPAPLTAAPTPLAAAPAPPALAPARVTWAEPWGLCALACTALWLIWTGPPGLTWLDAGELGAAAGELGVAHPPGFALFTLLTHGLMRGAPLGELAWRANLASVFFLSASVWALAWAARVWGARARPAALGALLFGVAPLSTLHGQTIEVYAGLGLWLGLAVGAVGLARRHGDLRGGLAVGLLCGLALGHHAELRLIVPLLVLAAGPLLRRARLSGGALLFGLLGASVVVAILFASLREPWRDWGTPNTPQALWTHLAGARIRGAYADEMFQFQWQNAQLWFEQTLTASPLLALSGLLGFARLARRPAGWLVPAAWALDALYCVLINPMGLADRQNGLLGLAALGLAAPFALEGLVGWVQGRWGARTDRRGGRADRWWIVAGGLVLLGSVALSPDAPGARRQDRGLPRLLHAALDEAPPEATAFVVSDHWAAGLAFAQVVEGARPDLAVVVRQHAWDRSSTAPIRRRLPDALPDELPAQPLRALAAAVEHTLRRAPRSLRWEWGVGIDAPQRPVNLVPSFPWFAPQGASPEQWAQRLTLLIAAEAPLSPEAAAAFAYWEGEQGFWALERGLFAEALRAFGRVTEHTPQAATGWTNYAQAALRLGLREQALQAAQIAFELAPEDPSTALNLARMWVNFSPQEPELPALLARVIAGGSALQRADAWMLRGVLAGNRGALGEAQAAFERALALHPQHAEARAGLEQLQRLRQRAP